MKVPRLLKHLECHAQFLDHYFLSDLVDFKVLLFTCFALNRNLQGDKNWPFNASFVHGNVLHCNCIGIYSLSSFVLFSAAYEDGQSFD